MIEKKKKKRMICSKTLSLFSKLDIYVTKLHNLICLLKKQFERETI